MLLVHFFTVDPIPIDDGGLTPGTPAEDGPQGPPTTTTATPCQDHSVTMDLTVTSAGVAMFELEPVDGPENMNIQVSLQHWGMSLQKQSRMSMLPSHFDMIMALFLTHVAVWLAHLRKEVTFPDMGIPIIKWDSCETVFSFQWQSGYW